MYADDDFLLALLKESDWLKETAVHVYEEQGEKIWTSCFALQEILIIARRENLDPEKAMAQVFELVDVRPVELDLGYCQKAAALMNHYSMTTFDTFHVLACGGDPIISSDKKYDSVGLKRIKLEEKRKK
ncbi:MAG: PIN domain-containing protein [archaeon]